MIKIIVWRCGNIGFQSQLEDGDKKSRRRGETQGEAVGKVISTFIDRGSLKEGEKLLLSIEIKQPAWK